MLMAPCELQLEVKVGVEIDRQNKSETLKPYVNIENLVSSMLTIFIAVDHFELQPLYESGSQGGDYL